MKPGIQAYFVEGRPVAGATVCVWNGMVKDSARHYVRLNEDGSMDCDCKGYQYRKKCIHMNVVRSKMPGAQGWSPGWHG